VKKRASVGEQRGEDRKPAEGPVWFVLERPDAPGFEGRMIDSSKSGFRAAHSHPSLSTGQQVRFHHSLGRGRALVIWTRILAPHVESGFLILDT
jgi:hypothetical protein